MSRNRRGIGAVDAKPKIQNPKSIISKTRKLGMACKESQNLEHSQSVSQNLRALENMEGSLEC